MIGGQGLLTALFGEALADTTTLPDFWELIVFGAGVGLIAFGAIDRSPGPAWLGLANLVVFVRRGGREQRVDALLLAARPAADRRG